MITMSDKDYEIMKQSWQSMNQGGGGVMILINIRRCCGAINKAADSVIRRQRMKNIQIALFVFRILLRLKILNVAIPSRCCYQFQRHILYSIYYHHLLVSLCV